MIKRIERIERIIFSDCRLKASQGFGNPLNPFNRSEGTRL